MVFCEIGWLVLCRFPARRDLDAALFSHQTKIGRSAESPLLRSRAGWSEKAAVRSVRTRRSGRSSRGGTAGKIIQEFRNSRDGNECAECRVDSVIHSTSPSRRENARRAIRSPVFQSQSATTEHPLVQRCAAAYLSLSSSTRSRAPRSQSLHRWQASYSPCPERACNMSATPGNLDTEQPFSYCYELPTQLRLESVANAHTAADLHVALGSHTALVRRALSVANE
jgi:hypothetical protein